MKKEKLTWYILFAVGLIYYLLIRYTSFGIPCLFYEITHLKCTGCGVTRMLYELSLFHWQKAMQANCFLFWTAPLLVFFFFYEAIYEPKQKQSNIVLKIEISYLITGMAWMLIRNIIHV